jgi:hypothetical protein
VIDEVRREAAQAALCILCQLFLSRTTIVASIHPYWTQMSPLIKKTDNVHVSAPNLGVNVCRHTGKLSRTRLVREEQIAEKTGQNYTKKTGSKTGSKTGWKPSWNSPKKTPQKSTKTEVRHNIDLPAVPHPFNAEFEIKKKETKKKNFSTRIQKVVWTWVSLLFKCRLLFLVLFVVQVCFCAITFYPRFCVRFFFLLFLSSVTGPAQQGHEMFDDIQEVD